MPQVVQTIRVNPAANTTLPNILQDTKLENVPTDDNYMVEVFATADSFDVTHKLEADTDVLIQPSIVGDTDRNPIDPDDFVGSFAVTGGSKLFLEISNAAGTAQQYNVKIFLTPLSMM
jgi:hypothetical protein